MESRELSRESHGSNNEDGDSEDEEKKIS